eukprot:12683769-Alexandrium_andersonii.AAC.1
MRTTFSTTRTLPVAKPFARWYAPGPRATTRGSESGSIHGSRPPTAFARGSLKTTHSLRAPSD